MALRFFIDPETELPHIYGHNVSEVEVGDVLRDPLEDRAGTDETRVAVGKTRAGRYLRVIYKHDDFGFGDDVFIITAYDLPPRQFKALRRRLRRRLP